MRSSLWQRITPSTSCPRRWTSGRGPHWGSRTSQPAELCSTVPVCELGKVSWFTARVEDAQMRSRLQKHSVSSRRPSPEKAAPPPAAGTSHFSPGKLVGLATCQIARAYGLKVLGTAGSEEGKKLVLQNGAHEVFNHKEVNYIDKIKESLGDKDNGVDVIIEMLANENLSNDLKLLSRRGRVIVVGCRGPIEINPRDTMVKETSIIGVSLFSSTKEEFQQFAGILQAGMEKDWVRPVIGSEYPLEKVAQAHKDIIHSTGKTGKMILLL